jgi:N-acetylglutamate synthase-like GNAT family acetyltransferase
LQIRKARAEESDTLTQIAQDAKRHWGYPEHWLERWQKELTITEDFIRQNAVYVAEKEGTIVGFYALIARGETADLDHMWVKPSEIGSGIGKTLFLHAMELAAAQRLSQVDILSDPNAEGFYRKMGASRVGESVADLDGQPRIVPHLKIDPSRQSNPQ